MYEYAKREWRNIESTCENINRFEVVNLLAGRVIRFRWCGHMRMETSEKGVAWRERRDAQNKREREKIYENWTSKSIMAMFRHVATGAQLNSRRERWVATAKNHKEWINICDILYCTVVSCRKHGTEGNGVMRCVSVRKRMQCGSEAATDKRGTSEHEDSA